MNLDLVLIGFVIVLLNYVEGCPPLPLIENGNIRVIRTNFVEVECHPAYSYVSLKRLDYSSNFIRCRNGEWNDPEPQCLKKLFNCPALNSTIPNGNVLLGKDFGPGAVARYYCDTNYYLIGDEERICQDKIFQWTGDEPECSKFNPTISKIADAINEGFVDKLGNYSRIGRFIGPDVEKEGLDLILVFDKSNSIHPDDFQSGINFAKFLVERFNVSNGPKTKIGGTRVAVITFGDTAKLEISLNSEDISDANEIKNHLDNIKCKEICDGATNMNEGLQNALKMIELNARPQAKKALFLTSDGIPTGTPPQRTARNLRKQDVEIYSVGVGKDVNITVLREIATPPSDQHVFLLSSFQQFDDIMKIIQEKDPKPISSASPEKCGFLSDKGHKAEKASAAQLKVGVWPWLAAILHTTYLDVQFKCNGILICKKWVLTSARCLFKNGVPLNPEELIVILGADDLTSTSNTEQNILVSSIHIEGGFNISAPKIQYNLGLIELASPATLNDNVRIICLPNEDESMSFLPDTKVKMIGWLLNNEEINRVPDEHIRIFRPSQANLSVMGRSNCESHLTKSFFKNDKSIFCAGTEYGVVHKCPTDEGSPLVVETQTGQQVLGIVSYNTGCTLTQKVGIFSRIKNELDWINEITEFCYKDYLEV